MILENCFLAMQTEEEKEPASDKASDLSQAAGPACCCITTGTKKKQQLIAVSDFQRHRCTYLQAQPTI